MSNNKYRFIYLRTSYEHGKKSAPFGCVVISLSDNKKRVTYQVSVCNPADDFDRAQARQLALGRLVESPKTAFLSSDNPTMHDITRAVMFDIEGNNTLPSRARKSATTWLNEVAAPEFYALSDRFLDPYGYDQQ